MCQRVSQLLTCIKEKRPLIHHITNYVTINDCANIVLAVGGSPVMADTVSEVEEIVSLASALVINIGKLNPSTIDSMLLAGKKANSLDIPVILDPVGVGATSLRIKTVERILKEVKVSIIRGNISEIKVLSGIESRAKGVDSLDTTYGGEKIAYDLARQLGSVIAITGQRDIISDGNDICILENGHKMMSQVTGTGCMSTSLVATFSGVTKDYFLSAVGGILTINLAGEKAHKSLSSFEGIGTFKVRLFDSVYNLSGQDILEGARINEIKTKY